MRVLGVREVGLGAMGEPAKDSGGLLGDALLGAIRQAVKEAVAEAVREAKADDGRLLSIEEASALLNVKKTWVGEAARRGELPSVKIGFYRRFKRADIEKFVEQKKTKPRR